MRQGQHKQRSRGRGRKVHNPSNRSYDSNGPDVKIRGNAAHIAEKYLTLARDAQVAGDRVASENYLQHAEHYNRIVAASQAHIQQQQQQQIPPQQEPSPQPSAVVGQETGGATETEADSPASEEEVAVVEGDISVKSEEEAPKARSNNTRQRRRRSPTGRNGSGASRKSSAADNVDNANTEEVSAPKSEVASQSEGAVPELDQTAAE